MKKDGLDYSQSISNNMERTTTCGDAKRAWRTPELTEVDYILTEVGTSLGGDFGAYS